MRVLKASVARKADLPNVVTLKQRFRWPLVPHGEAAFGGPGGAQILSCPMLGAINLLPTRGLGLP